MFKKGCKYKLLIKPAATNKTIVGSGPGCGTNAIAYTHLLKFLDVNHYYECEDRPDFLILNTCVVTVDRVNLCNDILKTACKKHKNIPIIIFGCFAGITLPAGNIFVKVSSTRLTKLDQIFEHTVMSSQLSVTADDICRISGLSSYNTNQFNRVLISNGCNHNCTFCNIKKAKGNTKSIPINDILQNIYRMVSVNDTNNIITLTSDDPGSYGIEIGLNLIDLIETIKYNFPKIKFKIPAYHPSSIIEHEDKLYNLVSNKDIIYLDIPIQSGSQRILKAMGRIYSISKVMEIVKNIKEMNANIFISTQVIVGFPGEEMADLQMSIECAKIFNYTGFFEYSDHPTVAANNLKSKKKTNRLNLVDILMKTKPKNMISSRSGNYHENDDPVWMGDEWKFNV